ncbi:MAG: YraN family protein [Anaerolineales bacterium]|jgi:putative endonuclease
MKKPGIGAWGEEQAVRYLVQNGYRVLARNYRIWEGELDIIAQKGETIIFVEVKTRTSNKFGTPEDSLHIRKQRRLLRAGIQFLEEHALQDEYFQFDLIAIECSPNRIIERLTHYEDVIGMDDLE